MRGKGSNAGFPRRSIFRTRPNPPGALEWPRDLAGGCARATAIGANRLLVENYTGILELTDTRVRLNTGLRPHHRHRRGPAAVRGTAPDDDRHRRDLARRSPLPRG